jgi:hypothetical protein
MDEPREPLPPYGRAVGHPPRAVYRACLQTGRDGAVCAGLVATAYGLPPAHWTLHEIESALFYRWLAENHRL